eukprot:1072945-Rhodomonas_salina.1
MPRCYRLSQRLPQTLQPSTPTSSQNTKLSHPSLPISSRTSPYPHNHPGHPRTHTFFPIPHRLTRSNLVTRLRTGFKSPHVTSSLPAHFCIFQSTREGAGGQKRYGRDGEGAKVGAATDCNSEKR